MSERLRDWARELVQVTRTLCDDPDCTKCEAIFKAKGAELVRRCAEKLREMADMQTTDYDAQFLLQSADAILREYGLDEVKRG